MDYPGRHDILWITFAITFATKKGGKIMTFVPANYRLGDRVICVESFDNIFAGVVSEIRPDFVKILMDSGEVRVIER